MDPANKMEDLRNLKGMLKFWPGLVRPRLRKVCFPPRVVIPCLLLGFIASVGLPLLPGAAIPIRDAVSILVSLASISFGGCITVLALILALPGARRIRDWSRETTAGGKSNSYIDLMFAVVWAAVVQLGLVLVSFGNYIAGGPIEIAPDGMFLSHRIALGLTVAYIGYSMYELFTVINNASIVAVVIATEERHSKDEGPGRPH